MRWLKMVAPNVDVLVVAPHNASAGTRSFVRHDDYDEHRFHYFWPTRFEKLTGRGILPALQENRWRYLQVPAFVLAELVVLLRLVKRSKPDLIYAHWFTPQAITASIVAWLTRTPFVFTTHASDVSILDRVPLSRLLLHSVCSRARAYTAVSEPTAAKLRQRFGEDEWRTEFEPKLRVIPMGVDPKALVASPDDVTAARRLVGLAGEQRSLLFLGRLAEKKGVRYLLDAAALLPDDLRARLRIIVAGDGQLRGALEAQVDRLGLSNVVFTGYVHGREKAALLAIADVVCLPSIVERRGDAEGMPVVLIEALAAGKVVLASDASGAEGVIRDGVNGFVFQQRSAAALAAAIARTAMLDTPSAAAVGAAAQEAAVRFDWRVVAVEHLRLFDQVVCEDPARQ